MVFDSSRFAALLFALATAAHAAGPILVEPVTGLPVKWDSSTPVVYHLETGRLNAAVTNAQGAQAVDLAFKAWTGLAGVSLSATPGTTIAQDITEANVGTFLGKTDGLTPIVFDDTGRITDLVLGNGASEVVLGFATPEIIQPGSNRILEGFACMNGKGMESETPESILNLMIHELGHMLGVGHSQLNGDVIFDGDAANNATIPIMYPILRSSSPDNLRLLPTPTLDDEVAMGFLYPSATYTTRGGNILGRTVRTGTDFRGANVIVRKVGDPRATAVSWASGVSTLTGGGWETHLLPPGDYTVECEPIDPSFTGGSAIGNFDPPPANVPAEFFSAPEVSDPTVDDPKQTKLVTVTAAQLVTGIDLDLNETTVALNPGAETAQLISKTGVIYETGGALPSYQFTIPVGATTSTLQLKLEERNGQPLDLFVRNAAAVASGQGVGTVVSDLSLTGDGATKTLLLSKGTTPALKAGTYFVAIVNRGQAAGEYALTASFVSPLAASAANGIGSGGGCAMRKDGGEPADGLWLLAPLGFALLARRGRRRAV